MHFYNILTVGQFSRKLSQLFIDNRLLCCTLTVYLLTHTCSVVGGDLISYIATAHIAFIGVGTILIASTYTQSTFIYVCVVGNCGYYINSFNHSLPFCLSHTLSTKVTTAHIASNDIVAYSIASMNTQSTFIYICLFTC